MVTRENLPRILLGGAFLMLLLIAAGIGIPILRRPKPVWFVEREFAEQWTQIINRAAEEPGNPDILTPPFTEIFIYDKHTQVPKGFYGIIITREPPSDESAAAPGAGKSPRIIPLVYDKREYRGAMALALNPWMIFRKYQDPRLTRTRTQNPAGGLGTLLLPGAEADAVEAWVTQLLQESPGVFPDDPQAWDVAEDRLFQGRRFQQGAQAYTWYDLWLTLFRGGTAWVYAPFSRVREQPAYQAATLDATIFPLPETWIRYGMQADILWAIPEEGVKIGEMERKKLEEAKKWLDGAEIQTLIADTIRWVPAHPQGKPYDTIAREAQVAWFSSSFIWQGANNVQEGYE